MNYESKSAAEIHSNPRTRPGHLFFAIAQMVLRELDARHTLTMIFGLLALLSLSAFTAKATTYVVTNVNNSGAGSLRQAILDANANPGADLINFNIPGAGGHPIFLKTLLPVITDPVTIDGYSQPGATPNTATMADNATLLIEITGTDPFFFNAGDGLVITAGSSTVKGLIINGFTNSGNSACGIRMMSKGGNVISGNFIGTNSAGFSAIPNTLGIYIEDSANNVIGGNTPAARNVISGNIFYGIKITSAGSTGNRVIGNFIGTDRNGTAAVPNTSDGVDIEKMGTGSSNTHIGGTQPGEGNLISGNTREGINTFGAVTDLMIQGNLIGTDVSGKVALGNGGHGIGIVSTGSLTVIGGSSAGARNIISGNKFSGVAVDHDASLVIQGNYIGTDITGKAAVKNGSSGIALFSSYNTVGGTGAGEGNVISGNGDAGVYITGSTANGTTGSYNFVLGNLIGIGADGITPLGNKTRGVWIYTDTGTNNVIGGLGTARNSIAFNGGAGVEVSNGTANLISGNSITANGGLGIDLDPGGLTANDAGDADTGPNNLQNYPVLSAASLISNGLTTVDGTLNSAANTKFTVEFFANDAADPTGFGEGQVYLGAVNVTTNASGNASFTGTFAGLSAGKCISATAFDPALNTSEFSQCKVISLNSPGALQFSSAAYSVNENGGPATVTVKRVGGNFGTVSVQYSTVAGGTATAGSDYTTVSGTLIWGHGDASDKTFTIPIVDDAAAESNETINLALSNATNGTLPGSPTAAVLTINDNESQPTISISDISQVEGNSGTANFAFTVSLSAASGQTVTVNYTTADNSAQAGSDYQPINGVASFAPGETSKPINVSVNGDTQVEPDEKFAVNLSNAVNAIIGKGQGTG
ncbi:MAG TPA: Calx-beta domain-containing protein, partial [Pyrinomonadaceae bacterium]|nr:Calx-beta domain-containing protein [Pyrinomonadaceae bacterium]